MSVCRFNPSVASDSPLCYDFTPYSLALTLTSKKITSSLTTTRTYSHHLYAYILFNKKEEKKMSRPLLSRKPDLFILVFFSLHLFFVTCVDCLDLWPESVTSSPYIPFFAVGRVLRDFYLETYQDKLVLEQPGWFVVFTWCELLFHVPVCVGVVWGLVVGMYPPPLPRPMLSFRFWG